MRMTGWLEPAILGLAISMSACGGGGAAPPAAEAPPSIFDAYVMANDQGNILQSDLYGITFNPLRAFRITTNKRISSMSASVDKVVVAAGDEQIDQLGEVTPVGGIRRLPD